MDIILRLGEIVRVNELVQVDGTGQTENTMVRETNRFILAFNF